jgi:DNA-directed RNA polymerase specialized sigma24 family protein
LLHDRDLDREFTRFVKEVEPRLSYAFYAAYGPEVGNEVTADALARAWEHRAKVEKMDNPAGHLYRVGQSKTRRYHRPRVLFPKADPEHTPERNEIEAGWLASPPDPADASCEADEALARWTIALPEVRDHRPRFVRRYWATRDHRAGLTH